MTRDRLFCASSQRSRSKSKSQRNMKKLRGQEESNVDDSGRVMVDWSVGPIGDDESVYSLVFLRVARFITGH